MGNGDPFGFHAEACRVVSKETFTLPTALTEVSSLTVP